MKYITYLAKKEITESFQEDVLEIGLTWRGIIRIIKIDPFLNLKDLSFHANQQGNNVEERGSSVRNPYYRIFSSQFQPGSVIITLNEI